MTWKKTMCYQNQLQIEREGNKVTRNILANSEQESLIEESRVYWDEPLIVDELL